MHMKCGSDNHGLVGTDQHVDLLGFWRIKTGGYLTSSNEKETSCVVLGWFVDSFRILQF